MRRPARLGTLALAAAAVLGCAALGCSDISSPERRDVYEWRLIAADPSGVGLDTLAFHWPRSALPVRIWVEDTLGLPDHLRGAIGRWKAAFLYDEFDATLTADSAAADVIVRGTAAPPKASAKASAKARLTRGLAPECDGATDLDIPADHTELRLPIRTYLQPRFDPGAPGVSECLALTATHELGHALGIFQHSPDPADLMFGDPIVADPSDRDRETAERAYHVPINLPPVRPEAEAR